MSKWIILSWIGVAVLTAVNVVVFWQLKKAGEQMLKMAFPGAKDMKDALAQMQKMSGMFGGGAGRGPNKAGMGALGGMGAMGGRGPGGGNRGLAGSSPSDAQLKAAMDMLSQMQKNAKK